MRLATLLALACLLPGCAISRVYMGPLDAPTGETHSVTTIGFLWNLVPAAPVNATAMCSNGVQRVTTRRGLLSVLVNGLTGGIVIPTQVSVTCAP